MNQPKHTPVKKPVSRNDRPGSDKTSPQPQLAESDAPYTSQPLEAALAAVRKMKSRI